MHVPRFGLVLVAVIVVLVGAPERADAVQPLTPVAATTSPTPAALAGAHEALFRPAPSQKTAALLRAHVVFAKPSAGSAQLGLVRARRPLTGVRTVLPVLASKGVARGADWLRVGLPGRPNGRRGWIRERATVASTTRWHILVETSERRVTIYRDSRRKRIVQAVVGKPSTPTPHGTFFVEEAIQLRPADVGAPYALALSARSNVLQRFNGGPGQIALHGLANVGGVLGSAVSHGCVRLDNDMMGWLVRHIGPGVPVTVTN